MSNRSFRDGSTVWKVLRISDAFTDDPDWVGDVSDGVPDADICRDVPFHFPPSLGKNTAVEFVVIPYTAATGLVVDAAETFSYEPVLVHRGAAARPRGTAIVGQTGGVADSIATRKAGGTAATFNTHYRFSCDGADEFTIRLHTFSGTPSGADAYEVWYRAVVE